MSKTIETHLQSNEVRIPKKSNEFNVTTAGSGAASCQYFKSSFARSLSFSQGPATGGGRGSGPYGGAEQHFTRDPEPGGMMNGTGGGGASIETSNGGIVKTLWNYAKGQEIKSANSSPAKRAITLKSSGGGAGTRKSIEANEIEVLRLRKVG
uniref:Uncharacterized protein n=1 Tax=Anopheles farauti TaxID=69004 RepID=A0A182Q9H5_9DIPT